MLHHGGHGLDNWIIVIQTAFQAFRETAKAFIDLGRRAYKTAGATQNFPNFRISVAAIPPKSPLLSPA